MSVNEDELVKINFDLDSNDWHGAGGESIWAAVIRTEQGPIYELRNSPWYANGVSYLDVVRAVPHPENSSALLFAGVAMRGGHSTYWLLVKPANRRDFEALWKRLQALGCTYESGTLNLREGKTTLYSVDVPPNADIHLVYRLLEEGEQRGIWNFAEGHCGHST